MHQVTRDYLTARALTRLHKARHQYSDATTAGKLAARIYANPDRTTWGELTRAKELMDNNPWIFTPDVALLKFACFAPVAA